MKTPSAKDKTIAELTADLQRTRADFENFRKQSDLQKHQYGDTIKATTVAKILPLLDDLDRAIAAHPELTPLIKSLEKTLADLSISKIPSAPGTDFNPDLHDAISMEEGSGDKEIIAEVLRPGYTYENILLRPTLVRVKKSN